MGELSNKLKLGELSRLSERGYLYQVSDQVAATALVPANFVFWAGSNAQRAVRLISARISASVAGVVTFGTLNADPALTPGNAITNLRGYSQAGQAYNEVEAIAALAPISILGQPLLTVGGELELLSPAVSYSPQNTGFAIVSAIGVATFSVVWLWAEIPRE